MFHWQYGILHSQRIQYVTPF